MVDNSVDRGFVEVVVAEDDVGAYLLGTKDGGAPGAVVRCPAGLDLSSYPDWFGHASGQPKIRNIHSRTDVS
jgi:hypothetical protein